MSYAWHLIHLHAKFDYENPKVYTEGLYWIYLKDYGLYSVGSRQDPMAQSFGHSNRRKGSVYIVISRCDTR
jgi:hypothetical protein